MLDSRLEKYFGFKSFSRGLKNKNQFAGQGVRRCGKRSIFKHM